MKNIPLTRPFFDEHEIEMVRRTLASGWVTQGPMVAEFERRFASLHGVQHALATTSCTAALHLATMALGLGPGDEVIVPAFTWVASANCAEYVGSRTVFADIELDTFNLDPDAVEASITPNTKAIVVVHLFGLSVRMDRIMDIANRHRLAVIEDAACAIGCRYDGVPVGGIGRVGTFSFHPRKIITTGEGGMLTTNSRDIADLAGSLRNHGTVGGEPGPGAMPKPYNMSPVKNLGFNLRLSDIQGAVGLAQLDKLPRALAERRQWAARYHEALERFEEIGRPKVPIKCEHTYQAYVVRLTRGGRERRNRMMEIMVDHGIWTRPGTHAVHRLDWYREKYGLRPEQFPNAVRGEDETITLPLFVGMSDGDFDAVVAALECALVGSG